MLTHHAIEEAGQLLFGEGWRRPLAKALGINLRTLRRYVAGTADPPAGLLRDLAKMVANQADGCLDAAMALSEAAERQLGKDAT